MNGAPQGVPFSSAPRDQFVRRVLVACIRFYQRGISRWTPAVCRFTPTCSQYAIDAIERYGPLKGGWLAFRRICRCHPLNKGGYDPVV